MTKELLTFLFFFVPIILFGLSVIVFYAIGVMKRNPEMTKLALISLIRFSLSVFASNFFYGKESMLNMARSLSFSNTKDVICFAIILSAFITVAIDIVKTIFLCNITK